MAHTCSAALVHCIDYRIQPAIYQWLQDKQLLGDCDIISLAGAAKGIDESAPTLWDQIEISTRLHKINTLYLMQHTDCGAYGGRQDDDVVFHTEVLNRAAAVIPTKYPQVRVRKLLADISTDEAVTITEIE